MKYTPASKNNTLFTNTASVAALAVLTTFLWGSAFPFVKISYAALAIGADDLFAKILFAGIRFVAAGLLVAAFALVRDRKFTLPDKADRKGILVLGFVQTTLQYLFFHVGLASTTGVKSSILYSANTFIAVLLAHSLYRSERLNKKKSLGCITGFLGVLVINLHGTGLSGGFTFQGEGMILLAAASFGFGAILSKRVAQTGDSVTITSYQLLFGGSLLLVAGLAGGGSFPVLNAAGLLSLFYLSVLSAVSFVLWTVLLKYNGVGRITVYNFMIPLFGTVLSALFLGESIFDLRTLLALLLVCSGIFIVNRPRATREPR